MLSHEQKLLEIKIQSHLVQKDAFYFNGIYIPSEEIIKALHEYNQAEVALAISELAKNNLLEYKNGGYSISKEGLDYFGSSKPYNFLSDEKLKSDALISSISLNKIQKWSIIISLVLTVITTIVLVEQTRILKRQLQLIQQPILPSQQESNCHR